MAERKVIIGRCATTTLPKVCDIYGIYGFLSRHRRYWLDQLIERYGSDAKLFDWEPEADCPRKQAKNLNDQCGARCPDLTKVV
jgi:hypothetical protein